MLKISGQAGSSRERECLYEVAEFWACTSHLRVSMSQPKAVDYLRSGLPPSRISAMYTEG
jgi:hypothetical protein